MKRYYITTIILLSFFTISIAKNNAHKYKVNSEVVLNQSDISEKTRGSCDLIYGPPSWVYDSWLYGQESYLTYNDPELFCANPYPYSITSLSFYLNYEEVPSIDTFSIFIATVDSSNSECFSPGEVIYNGDMFILTINTGGLWELNFPLSTPFIVNEPFFAGVYIHDKYLLDTVIFNSDTSIYPKSYYPDIITNDFFGNRESCNSFNTFMGDTSITLVLDTLNYVYDTDTLYWFRGRLMLDVIGNSNDNFNDVDDDGILDVLDNCITVFNPLQEDSDDDAVGDACCCIMRGDIDRNGIYGISDLTYMIDYMFHNGSVLPCPEEANINNYLDFNISDITYYIDYMFHFGPAPVACD